MSAVEPGAATTGLVERVKSILLKPGATWDVIDAEPASTGGLFKNYAAILALIPAICGLWIPSGSSSERNTAKIRMLGPSKTRLSKKPMFLPRRR